MPGQPTLYYCPQTRAETAFWMNEELGAPCEIEVFNLRTGEHKASDFLTINPMGKLPTLKHGNTVVTESAAVCAYLADLYPDKGLAPSTGSSERGTYYRWLFFAPSCIEPTMLDVLGGTARENTAAAGHGAMADVVKSIDIALSNGPYLLGHTFSAADVVFSSTLRFAMMFGAFEKKDLYTSYVDRMSQRPAAVSAREKSAEIASRLEGF